jgi:hypothetical protein
MRIREEARARMLSLLDLAQGEDTRHKQLTKYCSDCTDLESARIMTSGEESKVSSRWPTIARSFIADDDTEVETTSS